jgi:hypothetical protein
MQVIGALGRIAAGLLVSTLGLPAAAQSVWYVDCTARQEGGGTHEDPYKTIQYALERPATGPGDTLLVAPGVYPENLVLDFCSVTLRSLQGPAATVLDGQGRGSTVVIRHLERGLRPVLEGFTITGGSGTPFGPGSAGGGVFLHDTNAELIDCIVSGNSALRGGGVAVVAATATLTKVTLHDNVAGIAPGIRDGHGGGLFVYAEAEASVVCGRISGNVAGRGAGIFAERAKLFLDTSEVVGNRAGTGDYLDQVGEGGGLYAFAGSATLHHSAFRENLVEGLAGGGARLVHVEAAISGCTFENNAVGAWWPATPEFLGEGGGLSVEGDAVVIGTTFVRNHAPDRGGAFAGDGSISCSTFRANTARFGGAVWTSGLGFVPTGCYYGNLMLVDCTLEQNQAVGSPTDAMGGAVHGPAYLEACTLNGNHAFGHGGAAKGATLVDCVLSGNSVEPAQLYLSAYGGGAYQSHLEGCEVEGNTALGIGEAVGWGGGLYDCDGLRLVLHGNRADFGGGLVQVDAQTLTHLTVWGNQATYVADGLLFLGPGALLNSIVWNNPTQGIVDWNGAAQVTYSDIEGGWPGAGNVTWDPGLWAPELGDFHLTSYSWCVDAGDPLSPPDPDGSLPDMGALPFDPDWCGSPAAYCQAKVNSAGCTPSIGWSGTPSLSGPDDFVVTAQGVLGGQPGLLFWGWEPAETPFLGGTLCILPPLYRSAATSSSGSGCAGSYGFPITQAFLVAHGLWAGSTLYAQVWTRDPGFAPPQDVGMTDALRFTICK